MTIKAAAGAVVLGAALFSSAFGAARADSANKFAGIRSVAVISAIGDALTLKDIGLMVFSNAETSVPIVDWGLDDAIEKNVAATLSGKFSVVKMAYDRAAFAAVDPGFFDSQEGDIRAVLPATPPAGVDAYVVICKEKLQDPYGRTNQWLRGIGVYHHAGPFDISQNAVYAFYEVVVFDARTRAVVAEGSARMPDRSLFEYPWPWVPANKSVWPDSPSGMTDSQRDEIKRSVYTLIDQSLDHALANADLIDESQKLTPVTVEASSPPDPDDSKPH